MIDIKEDSKKNCCGCTACVSICPKNAITMKEDFEGFYYPSVDKEICINCGLCDKVCPYLNKNESVENIRDAYAIQNKDNEILNTSTSGGFFSSLGEYIIENSGYVCGVTFDKNFKIIHRMVNRKEDLKQFRGSKYAQSDLGDIFIKIKEKLEDNSLVCFSGTPCQVLGLKKFLRKDYDNLITVDFVCRSVPSQLFWEKYKDFQEKKYKSKIKEVYFRNKTYGYHSGTMVMKFENGKKYSGSNRVDIYNKAFHSDKCSRYSCYNCPAKGIDRVSDFTIFDSWYPAKLNNSLIDNDKGFTNLIIHTEKGKKIFKENIEKNFYSFEINAQDSGLYAGGMLEKSIDISKREKDFYKDISSGDLSKKIKKYIRISVFDRVFEKSKTILYKFGVLKYIKMLKKNRKK